MVAENYNVKKASVLSSNNEEEVETVDELAKKEFKTTLKDYQDKKERKEGILPHTTNYINSLENPSKYKQLLHNIPAGKFVKYVGVDDQVTTLDRTDEIDKQTNLEMQRTILQKTEKNYSDYVHKINSKTVSGVNFKDNRQKPKKNRDLIDNTEELNNQLYIRNLERDQSETGMSRTAMLSYKPVTLKENYLAEQYNPHSVN